jgi:hypothetical protein
MGCLEWTEFLIFGHELGHELLRTTAEMACLVTVALDNAQDTGYE